jgi:hypothetical protein
MKIDKCMSFAMFLVVSAASLLLLNSCGRKDASSEGCPANSYTANSDDILVVPADATLSVAGGSLVNGCSGGGSALYSPLTVVVTDANNNPKNNVCVTLYTDGFWYTDPNYNSFIIGEGPMNRVIATTNAAGRITLYWSTENLPAANPPSGTTPGTDVSSDSWVQAYSGTLTKTYSVNWTVSGCIP